MARRRMGLIQIDVCDVLDEIEDDDLLDEVRARKLIATPKACASAYAKAQGEIQAGNEPEAA